MTPPIQQVAASSPPLAVAGMSFIGFPISDWVQVVALVWLALQIGHFVYSKFFKSKE